METFSMEDIDSGQGLPDRFIQQTSEQGTPRSEV